MTGTVYAKAEETYLFLLKLFPNQPHPRTGKKRRIDNVEDFFSTIGAIAVEMDGENCLPRPASIMVHEPMAKREFMYQFYTFSDEDEDILIAAAVDVTKGDFMLLFNVAEEECGPIWLKDAVTHLLLNEPIPTQRRL